MPLNSWASKFAIEKTITDAYEKLTIRECGLFNKYVCSFHSLQPNPIDKNEIWFAIRHTKPKKLGKTIPDNEGDGVGSYNWETGEITFLSRKDGLFSDDVKIIAFDPFDENLIWFGGSGFIAIYHSNKKTFLNYTNVSGNTIYDVHEIEFDSFDKNSVWIASTGKIIHFSRKSQELELIEFVPQDMHKRFLEVDNEFLWFGSRVLLGQYHKRDRLVTYYELHNFLRGVTPTGMQFPQIREDNRIKFLKGRFIISIALLNHTLYIGTSDGLVAHDPRTGWKQVLEIDGIGKVVKNKDKGIIWTFTRSGDIFSYNVRSHEVREFPSKVRGNLLYNGNEFLYLGRQRLNTKNLELDKGYTERMPVPFGQQINSLLPFGEVAYFGTSDGLYKMILK